MMFKVKFYDSFEDMMRDMQQAQAAADARVLPWQRKIETGDHFVRFEPELTIYGEVLKADPEDVNLHTTYRFCRCYSSWCPEGELGSVHISVMDMMISRRLFEFLKTAGWPG